MSWEAIGALAEALGAVGVIVTLVFLAIQIRSNTGQTRLNTAGEAWSGILTAFEPVYYGDNVGVFQQGMAGELDPPGRDYLTFSMLMIRVLGQFELSLYQARRGALDDELLAMHSRLVGTIVTSPGGRRWWDETGVVLFGKDFASHVAAILASPDPGVVER